MTSTIIDRNHLSIADDSTFNERIYIKVVYFIDFSKIMAHKRMPELNFLLYTKHHSTVTDIYT